MDQPTCRTCHAIDLKTVKTVKGKEEALCRCGGPLTWEYVKLDVDWCFNHPKMREIIEYLPLPPP